MPSRSMPYQFDVDFGALTQRLRCVFDEVELVNRTGGNHQIMFDEVAQLVADDAAEHRESAL
jgi:hypothetical protein